MKRHLSREEVSFKVDQAIGSLAIENVVVSKRTRITMLAIASGRMPIEKAIDRVIRRYTPA